MRIVQVCPYSWSARGGVQTHVRHLSQHLSRRGHQVLVLAAGPVGRDVAADEAATTPCGVAEGALAVRLVGSSRLVPFNGSLAPIAVQPGAALAVRRALQQFQPDVVHVHEPFIPAVSLSAVWFARAPVVATFHAYCPPSVEARIYSLATRCLWTTGRGLAGRLSVSEAAAGYASARVGGAMDVVPNGVDVEAFARADASARPSGRTILFVGRLEGRKGFEVALRAFSELRAHHDDIRLVVVGTGPCARLADELPSTIRRHIVMLGEVEDEQLPSIYAAADVFIAPAVGGESFGTVLLEAMAAGRPIVATDIDGYREVVRAGVDALVVAPRDAHGLADAVARLLDDVVLAERLCHSARERVQQFDWAVVTGRIERAYRDVVRARVASSGGR